MTTSLLYNPRLWEPDKRADLYVREFSETDWKSRILLAAPPGLKGTQTELAELLVLAGAERAAHLEDIKKQVNPPWSYYFKILSAAAGKPVDEKSHPRTFELMYALGRLGGFVVNQFKDFFKRNRPSLFDPRLTTAIPLPGHPSYPSGHSTQAHLVSRGLAELVSEADAVLTDLAWDIAVNRERAGLHYRSDTEAGRLLAERAFQILRQCPLYVTTLDEAVKEWV